MDDLTLEDVAIRNDGLVEVDLTVGDTPKVITLRENDLNSLMIKLGFFDDPLERYTIIPKMLKKEPCWSITDNLFATVSLITGDDLWVFQKLTEGNHEDLPSLDDFLAGNDKELSMYSVYTDVDGNIPLQDAPVTGEFDLSDADIAPEQLELFKEALTGASKKQSKPSEAVLTGEYTSSYSKPTDTLERATMAFYRKLAVLSAKDSWEDDDVDTVRAMLSLVGTVAKFDKKVAQSLLSTLDTLMNALEGQGEDLTKAQSQLAGFKVMTDTRAQPTKKGADLLKQALSNRDVKPNWEEIIKRYQEGDSVTTLFNEYSVGSTEFYKRLREAGVELRRNKHSKNKKRSKRLQRRSRRV